MKPFNERLVQAMSQRNINQSQLVKMTGINKGALSSYVNGRYEPKQSNTYLLAKALRVNEAWLMGYDVPMASQHVNLSKEPQTLNSWIDSISKTNNIPQDFILNEYNNSMYADGVDVSYSVFNDFICLQYERSKINPFIEKMQLEELALYQKGDISEIEKTKNKIIFILHQYMEDNDIKKLYKLIEITFPELVEKYNSNHIDIDELSNIKDKEINE